MISDDESMSDGVDVPESVPAKAAPKGKGKGKAPSKPVSEDEQEDGSDDEEPAEDEFQVEKLVDHKFVKGELFYLVKWLGWEDEKDRSWEPLSNV
jgi:chromobox protein 1